MSQCVNKQRGEKKKQFIYSNMELIKYTAEHLHLSTIQPLKLVL